MQTDNFTQNYYVYELLDPRNFCVFYIGKGQGNRMFAHERYIDKVGLDAARTAKEKQIAEIHKENYRVVTRIVKSFDDEQDALDFEESLIADYGIDSLTNVLKKGSANGIFNDILKHINSIKQGARKLIEWGNLNIAAGGRNKNFFTAIQYGNRDFKIAYKLEAKRIKLMSARKCLA